ncbi:hypothetical protein JCM8097_007212, partial [Rhodosporidiobolus ruineniae]
IVRKTLSKEERQQFHADIARMVVATNSPFSWVDHPLVRRFFVKWFGLALPSRKKLTTTLLRREIGLLDISVKKTVKGLVVTLTCDGWNNVQGQHLVAFVITVGGKSYTIAVVDNSAVNKTGDLAYQHIVEQIEAVEQKYGCLVGGVCTDSGGDCARARILVNASHPHIITAPCYAHQVNLVVKDGIEKSPELKATAKQLAEVVTWFTHHSIPHALVRDAQKPKEGEKQRVLTFIRPVITRWTSNLASAKRLLELEKVIRILLIEARERLVAAAGKKKEKREKAEAILNLVDTADFWRRVKDKVSVLEPLATAANIAQATNCRLDQILLLLGRLYLVFVALRDDPNSFVLVKAAASVILASLNTRFEAADQEALVGTTVLNPFVGRQPLGLSSLVRQWHG